MSRKLTQEEVLEQFKKVHGNKYDYSKVKYKGTMTKVKIICPEHDSFFQTPNMHKLGQGCLKCAKLNKFKKQKDVIKKFKEVHGDKYDYKEVNYIKNLKKVIINCPKHGKFLQTPSNHLLGSGCPKCKRLNQKDILKRFKKVHGNKYDYSKVLFKTTNDKVEIICPEHGSFFQYPYNHFIKGCPRCSKNIIKSQEEHIEDFKKVHENKYDYSKVRYLNTMTKVEIICPEHGSFFQKPSDHKCGCGCPKCGRKSKGERKIQEFLESKNIEYLREYKLFKKYRFDFYVPNKNILIEFDGIQHFKPIEYFGGEKGFKETCLRDKEKDIYCRENDIKLIRISYKDFDKIEELLNKII